MKTLLLVLFASISAFSQIPLSGERGDFKIEHKELDKTFLLPDSPLFQVPERSDNHEPTSTYRFQIPLPSGEKEKTSLFPDKKSFQLMQQSGKTKAASTYRNEISVMPVKKLTLENSLIPTLEVGSFDKMNADFYFKQKQATISDDPKTSLHRYRFR